MRTTRTIQHEVGVALHPHYTPIATALLGGAWTRAALLRRAEAVHPLGHEPELRRAVIAALLRASLRPPHLDVPTLAYWLSQHPTLRLQVEALPHERILAVTDAWHPLISALSSAFLAGPWVPSSLAQRGEAVLGFPDRWMRSLAVRLVASGPCGRDPRELEHWLETDAGVTRVLNGRLASHRGDRAHFFPPLPRGESRIETGLLPDLRTPADLARWLGWTSSVLEGHVDVRHLHRHQAAFRDYLYRWRGPRLLEAPKDRLKRAQRRLLRHLLEAVPVHPAAHGFVKARSVHTHAALHRGAESVLRIDLRQFFPRIHGRRVHGLFRALGYHGPVATALTGLTTTWTPADICSRAPYSQPHLPQGAPTSPALANLIAFGLDVRLTALARAHGLVYSRYADDLTFSGRVGGRVIARVEAIVRGEDFRVHPTKTRLMRRSRAQRVTGLVVNAQPSVSRRERDLLRAVFHRARTQGWDRVSVEGMSDPQSWAEGRLAWITQAHLSHRQRIKSEDP